MVPAAAGPWVRHRAFGGRPAYTRPVTRWRLSARGLLCASILAIGLALCVSSADGAVTASQAIAWLNAQRAVNGLPAGISENPEWNEGCQLHMQWYAKNPDASNPHIEAPGAPGYTTLGALRALTRFWRLVRIGPVADHGPGVRPTLGSSRRSI